MNELEAFSALVRDRGLHGGLRFLNDRTPHRYTGIFRFDGDVLRNEALVDKYEPECVKGADAPMAETYCALVARDGAPLEIQDAAVDPRVRGVVKTPVVSYCGVLIRDQRGVPFGTLCHYDLRRCQQRTADLPLLQAAAQVLFEQLDTPDGVRPGRPARPTRVGPTAAPPLTRAR